jgi:hypothetical protein
MERAGEFRGNLQDLGQSFVWERMIESLVYILQGHATRKALENQGNRQSRAADSQLPAQELWVRHNPLIFFVRRWLPV